MKKVIVTGANGFIGEAFVKKMLRYGAVVYGVDINVEKLDSLKHYANFIPVVADFSKYDKLVELIGERDFDVFYHFAWQGGFSDALKNYSLQLSNAKATCDALSSAISLRCKKFVMAGTCNEFEIISLLKSKTVSPRYTCIYSTAKISAELICKTLAYNNSIEYSAGLICMTYGEKNYAKTLPNIIMNQLNNNINPKLVKGTNFYDMIYIDDIVDAFIALGEKGVNLKSYYIGHRSLKTFREIMTEVRDILNPKVQLLFGEFKDTANMDYSLIDLDALYNDTGFECKSDFKESILKTAEWVKSLNWEV